MVLMSAQVFVSKIECIELQTAHTTLLQQRIICAVCRNSEQSTLGQAGLCQQISDDMHAWQMVNE